MLQLPVASSKPTRRSHKSEPAPAYHAKVPAFIKAMPDDEAVLVPLCMSYFHAHDAFCHQADVRWIKRSDAAEDALEAAHESIADIIGYLLFRLRKLPSISPHWQHHYLGVVARNCINSSLSAEDYLEEIIEAARQIQRGERADAGDR